MKSFNIASSWDKGTNLYKVSIVTEDTNAYFFENANKVVPTLIKWLERETADGES